MWFRLSPSCIVSEYWSGHAREAGPIGDTRTHTHTHTHTRFTVRNQLAQLPRWGDGSDSAYFCPKAPTVTIFEDRAFKEVIELKWHCKVVPNPIGPVSLLEEEIAGVCMQRKGRVRTQSCWLQARARGLRRNHAAGTLILDFKPPDCEKINVCCLSLPARGALLWQPEQMNAPPNLGWQGTSGL